MSSPDKEKRPWREAMLAYFRPQSIAMLALGFSAGVPILLIFSTLSIWLREAGVERSTVTFFSWAALAYSFKFLWAPIVDMMPLPWLSRRLGRRRGWLLLAQGCIIGAIVLMSCIDPNAGEQKIVWMAIATVLLGFSSATQDIVIDAYRIESAEQEMQATLASMYIAGYRVGMLVAGAGSLILADFWGDGQGRYYFWAWHKTYLSMAAVMGIGVVATLRIPEPDRIKPRAIYDYSAADYIRFASLFCIVMLVFALTFFYSREFLVEKTAPFLGNIASGAGLITFWVEGIRFSSAIFCAFLAARLLVGVGLVKMEMLERSYISPVKDLFNRFGVKTALLMVLLIGFYRVSDIVMGVIANVFYTDLGFSKTVIAGITKTFGLIMTLTGGFLGGLLTIRFGVYRILFLGAALAVVNSLLFMLLSLAGDNVYVLSAVIAADNLSAGIATTAFVAFLSGLTSISFTAVQYAIFSSLMTLFPKLIGGYSGTVIGAVGYTYFFLMTASLGLPVLLLVILVKNQQPKTGGE